MILGWVNGPVPEWNGMFYKDHRTWLDHTFQMAQRNPEWTSSHFIVHHAWSAFCQQWIVVGCAALFGSERG